MEGAATSIVGVLAVNTVVLRAPAELRGSMKALLSMANRVTLAGGKAALAGIASTTGAGAAYLIAGSATLLAAIGAAALRRLRT